MKLLQEHKVVFLSWATFRPAILSLIITVVAVAVPLMIEPLVRNTRLRFLFERPDVFRLKPDMRLAPQP